jgi:TfoX/Sxy family transcriptional regulator of competence genes
MAYDEGLAERLRECLRGLPNVQEKRMFGGLCLLVGGHMTCGIVGETLMARIGPQAYPECLNLPHAREMDFTGKPLKGMVYVDPAGIEDDEILARWVDRCLAFVRTLPENG